jgi:GntR family galactonate operon transcriptional repressor
LGKRRRPADRSPAAAVDADLLFHRALLAASHNELLARMAAMIEVGLATRDTLVHGGPVEDPVPVHRAVFDAVRDSDPDAAERAMHALLDQAERDTELVRENG